MSSNGRTFASGAKYWGSSPCIPAKMENNKTKRQSILTETIVVALITLVAYLSLVLYQYNFLHYFGLPSYFLEFDMMQMLFVVLIMIVCIAVFLICTLPLIRCIKIGFNLKKHWLQTILYFIPCIFLIILNYKLNQSILFNIIMASVTFFTWLLQIWINKKISSDTIGESKIDSFFEGVVKKYGRFSLLIVLMGILFLLFSILFGERVAMLQQEYLVINTTNPLAIIKPYKDSFIAISFNLEAKTFGRNIYLISKEDISSKNIKITREHIGPLTNGSFPIEDNIIKSFVNLVNNKIKEKIQIKKDIRYRKELNKTQ